MKTEEKLYWALCAITTISGVASIIGWLIVME